MVHWNELLFLYFQTSLGEHSSGETLGPHSLDLRKHKLWWRILNLQSLRLNFVILHQKLLFSMEFDDHIPHLAWRFGQLVELMEGLLSNIHELEFVNIQSAVTLREGQRLLQIAVDCSVLN
jgi:hypothetical protein